MSYRWDVARAVGSCAVVIALAGGCGSSSPDDGGGAPPPTDTSTAGNGSTPTMPTGAGSGSTPTGSGGAAAPGSGGSAGSADLTPITPDDLTPEDITPPPPEVVEMLDPSVDWEALTIIFPTAYSAYDGVHVFQVPAHVDMATVELSSWQAIPSSAVTFDPDPDVEGGVLITVNEPVEQITIAASAGPLGGTAALFITEGTPEQWMAGEARYNNGVEFDLPMIDFASVLLDPNWMPPPPPGDLACNNCHSTGAKYFEIQHTPTQAARFSDDDLKIILTMGMKPPGVEFRLLPPMLGSETAASVYSMFHKWEATDDEVKGLIIYLRSLTPTGQGDIRLPDGTYVAPGTPPPGFGGTGGSGGSGG